MTFTVATWNVNGIRARQAQVQEFIDREQPEVLCLQEIKATPDQVPVWLSQLEPYWSYWHGGKGYSGVALYVKKAVCPDRPAFEHPDFDCEQRIVTAQLPQATVASVYVPNGGKDFNAKMRFLEALDQYAAACQSTGRPLVLCGDLNVAHTDMDVHPKERKPKAIGQLSEERALIDRLLSRGLVDVQRALEPDNAELFTWWAPWRQLKERNIGWRIDYILATEDLAKHAQSCHVYRDVGTSDHGPVIARFNVPSLSSNGLT